MLILEDVNKLAKFKFSRSNNSELTVLVKVKMESLKELSKPILSKTKKLDKINKLRKKEINIKNEILILSSVIFLSELKIDFLIMLFGLINFMISDEVIFINM